MFDKDDEIGEWNIFDCSIFFSNLPELFSFSCDNRDEFVCSISINELSFDFCFWFRIEKF